MARKSPFKGVLNMRHVVVVVLALLCSVVAVAQEDVTVPQYTAEKGREIALAHASREGVFALSVIPMSLEMTAGSSFSAWEGKRFDVATMRKEVTKQRNEMKTKSMALLTIQFIGDLGDDDDLKIPSDFCQYLFLENEKGESAKCVRAQTPFLSTVNIVNKTVTIMVEFANAPLKGAKQAVYVVNGLKFKENKFTFDLPYSDLFVDAPPSVRKFYLDTGVWEKEPKPRDPESAKGEELTQLRRRASDLEAELQKVKTRIGELEGAKQGGTP